MKLSIKFVVLLALMGATAVFSLAIAYWTVLTLEREITQPYRSISEVFEKLDFIKQRFEGQVQVLNAYMAQPAKDLVIAPTGEIRDRILELEGMAEFAARTGPRTALTIAERTRHLITLVDQGIAAAETGELRSQSSYRAELSNQFEPLHALIETVQTRMLGDLDVSLVYGEEVRSRLNRILLMCFVTTGLVALLGLLLLRRWVLRPISQLRQATNELAAGNFEYRIPISTHDEFGTLSDEVNFMAAKIVEIQGQLVDRERLAAVGEMTRRLVHNLRNPLAGIRSLAEIARSEFTCDSEQYDIQTRIVSAVDGFERWLRDILNSTTPLHIHVVPDTPGDLLAQVVETHLPLAQARSITLELDCASLPARAPFDHQHLEHAIVALVSNALEATPDGGTVRIIGRDHAPGGDARWTVEVHDSGPGVPEEIVPKIFAPYFTTKKSGTGIGLAVVSNVVRAHGGQIGVERSPLGGAAFIVELPGQS